MTTPLRAIVAEDEELMRQHLVHLIGELDRPIEIVAEAGDGGEAVALVNRHRPDLLFLDVQMPVLDGFAVVEKLMLGGEVPELIFTTAYDRYALQAFDLNAAHYLLKPISAPRLATACDRAAGRLAARPASTPTEELSAEEGELRDLIKSVRELTAPPARIEPKLTALTTKVRNRIEIIPLEDVFHISTKDGLNFIHTAKGHFITDFTLDELERRLDPDRFLRIYRSHLVNLRHIRALVPWTGGKFQVVLNDEAETHLSLSRYRLPEMRARLLW